MEKDFRTGNELTETEEDKENKKKTRKKIALAAVGGAIVGSIITYAVSSKVIGIKATNTMCWKPVIKILNIGMIQELERRGHPGNVVRCLETGEYFASQARAAQALGVQAANVSHHLAGRLPHVGGYTFEVIGEAVK